MDVSTEINVQNDECNLKHSSKDEWRKFCEKLLNTKFVRQVSWSLIPSVEGPRIQITEDMVMFFKNS